MQATGKVIISRKICDLVYLDSRTSVNGTHSSRFNVRLASGRIYFALSLFCSHRSGKKTKQNKKFSLLKVQKSSEDIVERKKVYER